MRRCGGLVFFSCVFCSLAFVLTVSNLGRSDSFPCVIRKQIVNGSGKVFNVQENPLRLVNLAPYEREHLFVEEDPTD